MDKQELIASAAGVIAAKARRLAAAVANLDATAIAHRQQRSRALLQIAASLSPAQTAEAVQTLQVTVTAQDRKAAANEVYALLQRRSGNAVVLLYDIALGLHYESYWAYLRGLALHENGDSEAASTALDAVEGYYADAGKQMAEQFRQRAAGIPDPMEEAAQQLYDRMAEQAGGEDELHKTFRNLWSSVTGLPPVEDDDEQDDEEDDDSAAEVNLADIDLAAETAQCFAERLADGDYAGARALLGEALEDLSADDLRQEYEQMVDYGRDGEAAVEHEEIEVLATGPDSEVVDLDNDELASVYVTICGANFNEAVIVTVAREQGQARITAIEWGRP